MHESARSLEPQDGTPYVRNVWRGNAILAEALELCTHMHTCVYMCVCMTTCVCECVCMYKCVCTTECM